MIDIPEERILKEITDILMNDLPKVLLELEEQSEDSIRLPPFRYVGLEENLPPGTGLPYAFVEIEEGEYTEKDRIINDSVINVGIIFYLLDFGLVLRYFNCFRYILRQKRMYKLTKIEKLGKNSLLIKTITKMTKE